LTVSAGVDTREVLIVRIADLEDTVLGTVGACVRDTNAIIDVLAIILGVRILGVAHLEAGAIGTNEVMPFNHLRVAAVITVARHGEGVRVDETTQGVTTQVGTMGIKLTSIIIGLDVELSLVEESNDLKV
jgi:hypothetical protein